MYRKILVALNNSRDDESLLRHIGELAPIHGSHVLLVHVADGWVARYYDHLELADSEEMKTDRAYLDSVAAKLRLAGLEVTNHLALGNPPDEIIKVAEKEQCDLIAMTTHGHRFLADLFLGSTIESVRHRTRIPVLIIRTGH